MRILIAAAAFLIAGGAIAQDAAEPKPDPEFPGKMFAGKVNKDKNYACYVRFYDEDHLVRHPLQKVRVMKLLVTAESSEDDPKLTYSFRLGVNFRARKGNFDSSGYCGSGAFAEDPKQKPRLNCGVDCDGGGISVEMTPDSKATLVRLESIRIWQNNRPDDEGLTLSGGADDKIFRLDRTRLDQCRALITDRKELAAMRSIENRR